LISGSVVSIPRHIELVTFPALELKGLIKYFQVRKRYKPSEFTNAAIILLFGEENDAIFYKYRENFNDIFATASTALQDLEARNASVEEMSHAIEQLQHDVMGLMEELYMAEMPSGGKSAFPSDTPDRVSKRSFSYKIIVCGDPQVGKTSLILRFSDHVFRKTYIMSIGVNITSKVLVQDDAKIEFVIWDIAGQSKFEKSRQLFYQGARGIFIVFDLTRPETFHSIDKWCHDIKQAVKADVPGYILGNKADLINESNAFIDSTDIENLACDLNLEFIQTSALTGENVDDAFTRLANLIRNASRKE
jgi:small GTP-binding protein